MPIPRAPSITLDDVARNQLEALLSAGSTPQTLAFRAAEDDEVTNLQIAAEFGGAKDTVGLCRRPFAAQGLAGLQHAPRSGRPGSFSPR